MTADVLVPYTVSEAEAVLTAGREGIAAAFTNVSFPATAEPALERLATALEQAKLDPASSGAPPEILACYTRMVAIDAAELPYIFGGGHGPGFGPTLGLVEGNTRPGYDCSGAVSAALHAGGILEHPSGPLATPELMHWGLPGEGKFLTVWVHNSENVNHCVIEVKGLGPHRFWEAGHTGMLVGWITGFDTTNYTPRRRKA